MSKEYGHHTVEKELFPLETVPIILGAWFQCIVGNWIFRALPEVIGARTNYFL